MRLKPGTEMQAQALLFDMDGTLLNSIAVIERLWAKWAARHNLGLEEILTVAHGRPTIETMRLVAPHLDHEGEAARYTAKEIAETAGIVAIPGAAELLGCLVQNRWCVVTSANRELAIARLRAAGLPISQHMITIDDVTKPKPHPESYVRAAQLLGVEPIDCIVFEDAPAGLQAAREASMRTIATATTMSALQLEDYAWVPDLSALEIVDIGTSLAVRVV